MAMNETFAGVSFNIPDNDVTENKKPVMTERKKEQTKTYESRRKNTIASKQETKAEKNKDVEDPAATVKIPVPPKKITKSVHKNFLLTEEENHILETIAKQNGMSQNELIEGLIQQLKPNMK